MIALKLFLVAALVQSGSGLDLAAADPSHADDLESIAVAIATESDPEASSRKIRRNLSRLARKAKRQISQAHYLPERRELFDRFFFKGAGFRAMVAADARGSATGEGGAESGLLLHEVLESRRGTCVGLAQVYLILADRLDLPVAAAATPAHLFVRWVEGGFRINTELLEQGAEHSDAEYRRRYRIREPDLSAPVFLRELTTGEVTARIYNNRGVIRSRRGHLEEAASDYARAIELDPRFPAPYYNRGLDSLNAGHAREALASFDAALALHADDAWALNNRGLAHLALGLLKAAQADLRKALVLEPGLAVARKNLSLVTSLADQNLQAREEAAGAQRGQRDQPQSRSAPAPSGETAAPRP